MKKDIQFIATEIYGESKIRAWMEEEAQPGGSTLMIGMSSRTDYDEDGNMVSHAEEKTGATMRVWQG